MADPKNKWSQPDAPPAPMFFGEKERDLVKQVNDELAERVIGQTIAYYPISVEESNFNDIYGEAIEKVSLPPVRVYAYVVVENEQTNERYGYEYQNKLTVNFHRKRLTEDQNLHVRVGDFVQYGEYFYEIVKTFNDTKYYFGQVEHKFQVSAECVRARDGAFRIEPALTRLTGAATVTENGTTPAPRAAPYPPLDATYITVTANSKLPNERVLTAGSNISLTDAAGSITVGTTSEFTASNLRVGGDLTLIGTLIGGSPVKISGAVEIIDAAGTTIATLGSSSLGSDVLSASFGVVTNLSASGYISASTFYGDGGGITNLPAAAISSYTNAANNRVITSVNSAGVTGESNLTFDGTSLTVTGDVTASANISSSYFYGDGSNLTGITSTGGTANAQGPVGSLQFQTGSGGISGSTGLSFATGSSTLTILGALSSVTLSGSTGVSGSAVQGGTLTVAGNIVTVEAAAALNQDLTTDASPTFTGATISGLTATRLVSSDGSSALGSTSLNSWVAGTANRVSVADDGDGTITLSTPQNTDTSAEVEFAAVSGSSGISGSAIQGGSLTVAGNALTVEAASAVNQDLTSDASPTFTGATVSGLTATRLVSSDGSSALASTNLSTWVAGTSNQVSVANDGDGTITLSTPQNLDTGALVQFAQLTASAAIIAGTSHLSGGIVHKRKAVTGDYSVALTDYYLGVDTTSGAVTLTIPLSSTATEGQTFVIKDEGGGATDNAIILARSGEDTFDGATSATIESPYGALSLYTNGSKWFIY